MPIINTPIIKSLKEEFRPYAEEVILNNLPMIDGLLLSHKKVLWGMFKKGVLPNKPFVKNIKNQGFIVEYYVYGDMPLGKVMVNMANNGVNIPYLQWDGNSGDKFRKKGKPASPRYTGSKTTDYGISMLEGIKKNAVPMKPNYDNSEIEPIISPSIAPNILLNNSESIAISEASKIPPHNVYSVCDSITDYLTNKDIDKAIDILQCPDFCNGGKIVYDKTLFKQIYKKGKGSFSLIGRYTYDKKKNIVNIIEVPYTTTIDAIESAIINKYEKGKLFSEVLDIRDATDKDGLRLEIKLKKNTNIENFEKLLRSETPFESKYSCNFTILGLDYIPYLMNLQGIYDTWIQHRINCIKNEAMFDIDKNKEELNKLYGLKTINEDLDRAIQIIRSSKTERNAIDELINYFKLNEKQAEYIATIRLVNINQEWIERKIINIKELEIKNTELTNYYNSEQAINKTIISQLEEVKKKFGQPRRTEIIYPSEIQEITQEDLIEDNTVTIVLTKEQYIKKNLKYSESQKLKDEDEILQIFQTNNKSDILLFTNKGNVLIRKTYELEECLPSVHGTFIPNWLGEHLNEDEKIIYVATTNDYNGKVLTVFEDGKIGCTDLEQYKCKQNRQVSMNAYNTESPLVGIKVVTDDVDIFLLTDEGKALIINTKKTEIRPTKSRNTKGVVGIRIKDDNKVIGCIIDCKEDNFTIHTEKGKEIDYMLDDVATNTNKSWIEYLSGNRGNVGNLIYNTRQKKDKIVKMVMR